MTSVMPRIFRSVVAYNRSQGHMIFQFTSYTYFSHTTKIKKCRNSLEVSKIFADIKTENDYNQYPDRYVLSLMLKKYCSFKDYDSCWDLFSEIKQENDVNDKNLLSVEIYSMMIKVCADECIDGHLSWKTKGKENENRSLEALHKSMNLFSEMKIKYGISHNKYIITQLLSNCSKILNGKSVKIADWILNKHLLAVSSSSTVHSSSLSIVSTKTDEMTADIFTWNALLNAYLTNNEFEKAMSVYYNHMNHIFPNSFSSQKIYSNFDTFSIVINGLRLNCAECINFSLKDQQSFDEIINDLSLTSTVKKKVLISKQNMIHLSMKLFAECIEIHGYANVYVFGTLLHNFCSVGDIQSCHIIIHFMLHQQLSQIMQTEMKSELESELSTILNGIKYRDKVPLPNITCFNLMLKCIVIHLKICVNLNMKRNSLNTNLKGTETEFFILHNLWIFLQLHVFQERESIACDFNFVSFKYIFMIFESYLDHCFSYLKLLQTRMMDNDMVDEEEYENEIKIQMQMETDANALLQQRIPDMFHDMIHNWKMKANDDMMDSLARIAMKFNQLKIIQSKTNSKLRIHRKNKRGIDTSEKIKEKILSRDAILTKYHEWISIQLEAHRIQVKKQGKKLKTF